MKILPLSQKTNILESTFSFLLVKFCVILRQNCLIIIIDVSYLNLQYQTRKPRHWSVCVCVCIIMFRSVITLLQSASFFSFDVSFVEYQASTPKFLSRGGEKLRETNIENPLYSYLCLFLRQMKLKQCWYWHLSPP